MYKPGGTIKETLQAIQQSKYVLPGGIVESRGWRK